MPQLWKKPLSGSNDCIPSPSLGRPTKSTLHVPFQNVLLNTSNNKQPKILYAEPFQQSGSKTLRTISQKAEPICMGHFHNRHVFQQQLIEKQKKKLQEQQKTILELKENQRLAEARWAAERAAAITDAQSHLLSNPREEEEPKITCQDLLKYVHCIRTLFELVIWGFLLWGKEAPEFLCSASRPQISPFPFCAALLKQKSPIHCIGTSLV